MSRHWHFTVVRRELSVDEIEAYLVEHYKARPAPGGGWLIGPEHEPMTANLQHGTIESNQPAASS